MMSLPKWKKVAKLIEKAVDKALKDEGVSVNMKGFRYSDTTSTYKVEVCLNAEDGTAMTKERADWIQYAEDFGLRLRNSNRGCERPTLIGRGKIKSQPG